MIRPLTLSLALLCSFFATHVAAQDGPAERDFAKRFLPKLQKVSPESVVYSEPGDPLQINFDREDGSDGPVTVNLHRMFQFCQTISPQECNAQMAEFIAEMRREPPGSKAENLRIIVRDASYLEYVENSVAGTSLIPVYRKIGDDLFAILALDAEQSISVIGQDTLKDMGLDGDEAWDRARRETLALILAFGENDDFGQGLVSFEGDEYVGSMALMRDQWAKVAARQGGKLAVAIPSDYFFLAVSVADGEELKQFKELAVELCQMASRCISPNVYRIRDGGWVIAE
ncbi:hypothetical protein [Erythrobacter crassostreae]|uniref:DUF1444 family protein n=1 Tax=Erythrobacter crassostreae TaxID=2828328 RepID=A0A9X1JP38_9SPHN|nr:hypothetical protein [Erythrobacter crassostrea]MBV7259027.1 hypothetical protein [Erythrobacter crassostrea]